MGGPRLGVVGDDDLVDAVRSLAGHVRSGDARHVLAGDVETVVAGGESGLLSVARQRPTVPVLPVEAGTGLRSVDREDLRAAVASLGTESASTDEHTLLSVSVGGESVGLAVYDVFVVTAEPAHISEYAVTTGGEAVTSLRADGIVVATPAGTGGYARAAGAPLIPPGPDVLAVVPVAAFATTTDHWVLPQAGIDLVVEREEADVELRVDDRKVATPGVGVSIRVEPAHTLETVVVPESRSPFGRRGREVEKL